MELANSLRQIYIAPYTINDFSMKASVAYCHPNGRVYLICIENGMSMQMDDTVLNSVMNQNPKRELQILLAKKGLATLPNAPVIKDQNTATKPTFILIDMTNGCNLNCKYCFRKPNEEKELISEAMLDDIIAFLQKYLKESGLPHLTVQPWGGEPLVAYERIQYMVKRCRDLELPIEFTIETNGTLITRELAKELFESGIHVGVSVDGNHILHDAHRPFLDGSGSLSRIEEAVRYLRESGYRDIGSISVVTRDAIGHVAEIVNYLSDDLGVTSMKLNLMKGTTYNERELLLSEEEIQIFANELVNVWKERRSQGKDFPEINLTEKRGNLLHRNGRNICISKGCSGGRELICINRKGEIFPCEMADYKEECIGTIYDQEPLEVKIKRAIESNDYFKPKRIADCERCGYWYFCRGGCSSAVKYEHGRICDVDRNECHLNKALYELLIQDLLETEMKETCSASAYYALGYACNHNCIICPVKAHTKNASLTETEEWNPVASLDRFIEAIEQNQVRHVTLSGGEPTLQPLFFETLKRLAKQNLTVTILSNGENFAESAMVDQLLEAFPKERLNITTAIHASNAALHEAICGRVGAFERTIKGLKNLYRANVNLTLKHCIHGMNAADSEQFLHMINQTFPDDIPLILCEIDYLGIEEEHLQQVKLSYEELGACLETCIDVQEQYQKRGSRRRVVITETPLCITDPYYWKNYDLSASHISNVYAEETKQIRITENVASECCTDYNVCRTCRLKKQCPGSWKSAVKLLTEAGLKAI